MIGVVVREDHRTQVAEVEPGLHRSMGDPPTAVDQQPGGRRRQGERGAGSAAEGIRVGVPVPSRWILTEMRCG